MTDTVEVATSGKTVPRSDKCVECGQPMLYRVREMEGLMFCGNFECSRVLKDVDCGPR